MNNKNEINKIALVFFLGLGEQLLYTLYLLAVNRYLMWQSSFLMLVYMTLYLLIINYAMKDSKNSLILLLSYALASSVGNFIALSLRIIK